MVKSTTQIQVAQAVLAECAVEREAKDNVHEAMNDPLNLKIARIIDAVATLRQEEHEQAMTAYQQKSGLRRLLSERPTFEPYIEISVIESYLTFAERQDLKARLTGQLSNQGVVIQSPIQSDGGHIIWQNEAFKLTQDATLELEKLARDIKA